MKTFLNVNFLFKQWIELYHESYTGKFLCLTTRGLNFKTTGAIFEQREGKSTIKLKKYFVCLPWPKAPLISFHTSTDSKKNTSALLKRIIAQMLDLCYVIIIPVDRKGNEETSLHD